MTAANACDTCQRPLPEDDGGLCPWCADLLWWERADEWDGEA